MPPRSFDHWYRGSSVEAASRSSAATPWGFRGSLVAPVTRAGVDRSETGAGGLGAGGSTLLAAAGSLDLRKQMSTWAAAAPSTAISMDAVASLEIVAAAEARASSLLRPSGGWSQAGASAASVSIDAACAGGAGVSASAAMSLAIVQTPEWVASPGGLTQVASIAAEAASAGLSAGLAASVVQASACGGVGGSAMGGVSGIAVSPPARSFKYWRRGGVIGDVGPRRGDFAIAYRGWLGFPSAGKVGGADVSVQGSSRLRFGGSTGDQARVDGRAAGVGAIGFGGEAGLNWQGHVDASGGVATMGEAEAAGVWVSITPRVGVAVGGEAGHGRTVSGTAAASLSPGGGSAPRLDAACHAIVAAGMAPAAWHRVGVEVDSWSSRNFGASARVNVGHRADVAAKGVEFGGGGREGSTTLPGPSGGLGSGGACLLSGLGLVYRIYSNGGLGGPIDYSTPIAVVDGLEWTSAPLPADSFFRFGVRTYDAASGLLEENLDASVALIVDHAGRDATRIPPAPVGLRAIALGGGRARLEWTDGGGAPRRAATSFHVYVARDSITEYSSPIVVSASGSRGKHFSTEIDGLADGRRYAAVVRAGNAYGEESNVSTIYFTADSTPPMQVDGLSVITSSSVA